MIFGECPYEDCDGSHAIPLASDAELPAFSKETCETCGRIFWLKHSRIDPVAYTEDAVLVNEETRSVEIKEVAK